MKASTRNLTLALALVASLALSMPALAKRKSDARCDRTSTNVLDFLREAITTEDKLTELEKQRADLKRDLVEARKESAGSARSKKIADSLKRVERAIHDTKKRKLALNSKGESSLGELPGCAVDEGQETQVRVNQSASKAGTSQGTTVDTGSASGPDASEAR